MDLETATQDPSVFTTMVDVCQRMPAALVVAVAVIFLAVAIWIGREALMQYRANQAIRTAPLGTTQSAGKGLVKLVGTAQPPPPPPGYDPQSVVWSRSVSRSGSSHGSSSVSRSINEFYLQDAHGKVRIDPAKADVVASQSTSRDDVFGGGGTSQRMILAGDPIFALGRIERLPGAETAYALERSAEGVFLVSGKSESTTLQWLQIVFGFFALVAAASVLAMAGLLTAHLVSYQSPAIANFIDVLKTRPMDPDPGHVYTDEELGIPAAADETPPS